MQWSGMCRAAQCALHPSADRLAKLKALAKGPSGRACRVFEQIRSVARLVLLEGARLLSVGFAVAPKSQAIRKRLGSARAELPARRGDFIKFQWRPSDGIGR
jgi:hypothetical protein